MNNKEKDFILYAWNNETKEFWLLGEKIDYVHNPNEWKKYLNDLVSKNKELETSIATKDNELLQLKEENNQLETNIDEAIELLTKSFNFCENDSQGEFDICNVAINREKKAIEILERGKE